MSSSCMCHLLKRTMDAEDRPEGFQRLTAKQLETSWTSCVLHPNRRATGNIMWALCARSLEALRAQLSPEIEAIEASL